MKEYKAPIVIKIGNVNLVITPFSLAWSKYLESKQYKETVKTMEGHGMKQPYIQNILYNAFTAGCNAQ